MRHPERSEGSVNCLSLRLRILRLRPQDDFLGRTSRRGGTSMSVRPRRGGSVVWLALVLALPLAACSGATPSSAPRPPQAAQPSGEAPRSGGTITLAVRG